MTSPTLCLMPWIGATVKATGDHRMCCQTIGDGAVYKKEDGTPYNAAVDGLHSSRNCEAIRKFRLQFLAGEKPPECRQCWHNEQFNFMSKREGFYLGHMSGMKDVSLYTDADGYINPDDFPLTYFDLRFGNLCNLKCSICGEYASNQFGKTIRWEHGIDNQYIQDIIANSEHIREVYITGGEPFITKTQWDFVDALIESGHSDRIFLRYNTNGTLMKQEYFDKWNAFRKVIVIFSIDGIGELFEQLRTNAKWDIVSKNMDMFDEHGSEKVYGGIIAAISKFNIFEFHKLGEWYLNKNFKNITSFRGIMLVYPYEFSMIGKSESYDELKDLYKDMLKSPLSNQFNSILKSVNS